MYTEHRNFTRLLTHNNCLGNLPRHISFRVIFERPTSDSYLFLYRSHFSSTRNKFRPLIRSLSLLVRMVKGFMKVVKPKVARVMKAKESKLMKATTWQTWSAQSFKKQSAVDSCLLHVATLKAPLLAEDMWRNAVVPVICSDWG